jgi:hypothetical protein
MRCGVIASGLASGLALPCPQFLAIALHLVVVEIEDAWIAAAAAALVVAGSFGRRGFWIVGGVWKCSAEDTEDAMESRYGASICRIGYPAPERTEADMRGRRSEWFRRA